MNCNIFNNKFTITNQHLSWTPTFIPKNRTKEVFTAFFSTNTENYEKNKCIIFRNEFGQAKKVLATANNNIKKLPKFMTIF